MGVCNDIPHWLTEICVKCTQTPGRPLWSTTVPKRLGEWAQLHKTDPSREKESFSFHQCLWKYPRRIKTSPLWWSLNIAGIIFLRVNMTVRLWVSKTHKKTHRPRTGRKLFALPSSHHLRITVTQKKFGWEFPLVVWKKKSWAVDLWRRTSAV